MTRQITVYSVPSCIKCIATKRWLDKRYIPYESVDASLDPKTADSIRSIAETDDVRAVMPFVQVSNGDPAADLHWFDFRPDYLAKYASGSIA